MPPGGEATSKGESTPDALARAEDDARREAEEIARASLAGPATSHPAATPEPAAFRGGIEAGEVSLQQAVVGGISADRVAIGEAVVGGVTAGTLTMDRGVAMGVLADRVSIVQGGAARILAGDVSIDRGVAGIVAGWNVRLGRGSFAGAVVGARVDGEVRALLDWRGVLAVALAVLGIAWLRRRR